MMEISEIIHFLGKKYNRKKIHFILNKIHIFLSIRNPLFEES